MKVQQWLDDDQATPENEYEAITCPACARLHFLNHATPPRCGHNGPEGEAAKAISRNTPSVLSAWLIQAQSSTRRNASGLMAMHARGGNGRLKPIEFEMPQEPEFSWGGGRYSTAPDYFKYTGTARGPSTCADATLRDGTKRTPSRISPRSVLRVGRKPWAPSRMTRLTRLERPEPVATSQT
jgi:hypothetical protein